MKKQVALAVAAALSLSVAGTALAAPTNPFIDVPANHWAYDALASLQKDGVVTGYGDGTFRGDRNLTRYEMAAMIAKITMPGDDKNGPLIKRLQSEFATELYNLGVRVDKLEKGASTIKFTGDARIRYQENTKLTLKSKTADRAPSRFQERVRINMVADVNDNVQFFGRLKYETTSNKKGATAGSIGESDSSAMYLDRAEFAWTKGNWGVSAGRMLPKLGQGLIYWDERADGIMTSYKSDKFRAQIGYLDLLPPGGKGSNDAVRSHNMGVADLGFKVGGNANITAAYAKAAKNAFAYDSKAGVDGLELWTVGGDVKFGDFTLWGEYIRNQDADYQDKGAWARLQYKEAKMSQPGSYHVYAEYMKLGANSYFGDGGSRMGDIPSVIDKDFGTVRDGVKGWGAGFRYVVAKNMNWEVYYHDTKPFNGNGKYYKSFNTGVNFAF